MYQTDLVELLVTAITTYNVTNPPPAPVTPVAMIAPLEDIISDKEILTVIPDMFELDISNSSQRRTVVTLASVKYVSIVYGANYVGLDDRDIGPWAESKGHLDYMEKLGSYLCKLDYSPLKLVSAEVIRVEETLIQKRKFLSTLVFGFSQIC